MFSSFLLVEDCRSEVMEINLIVTSYNCLNFVRLMTVQCSSGYKRGQASMDIQNEIINVLAAEVLEKILNDLQTADFFSIMVDELTDSSN